MAVFSGTVVVDDIDGDTVVVGARGADDAGSNSGSAYVYDLARADAMVTGNIDGNGLADVVVDFGDAFGL